MSLAIPRVKPLGWALYEILTSAQITQMDLNISLLDAGLTEARRSTVANWPERSYVAVTAFADAKAPIAWDYTKSIRGGIVVVLTSGATLASQDGHEWVISSGASSHPWTAIPKCVAMGVAASGFCFLTGDPANNVQYYSANGYTWTSAGSTTDPTSALCYVPWLGTGLGLWVQGSVTGMIHTSTNPGVDAWVSQTVPGGFAAKEIVGIAASATGIVAITSTSHNKVLVSADAVTWAEVTLPTTQVWRCIDYDATDEIFIAIGDSAAYKSADDGQTWTAITKPSGLEILALASDGYGLWVCTFNTSGPYAGGFRYSLDQGATWTVVEVGDHATVTQGYRHLIYAQDRFMATRSNAGTIDVVLSMRSLVKF
jgi:hypothetical protein